MKAKPDTNERFVIIMAGGKGERFWPVSRQKTPKQLITLLGNRSFLQQAVDRVLPLVPIKNIFVITNEVQAPVVRQNCRNCQKTMSSPSRWGATLARRLRSGLLWSARARRPA